MSNLTEYKSESADRLRYSARSFANLRLCLALAVSVEAKTAECGVSFSEMFNET